MLMEIVKKKFKNRNYNKEKTNEYLYIFLTRNTWQIFAVSPSRLVSVYCLVLFSPPVRALKNLCFRETKFLEPFILNGMYILLQYYQNTSTCHDIL